MNLKNTSLVFITFVNIVSFVLFLYIVTNLLPNNPETLKYMILFQSLIWLLTLEMILIFVQLIMVKPIKKLTTWVEQVQRSTDYSIRIKTSGQNEISMLSSKINAMLDALQKAHESVKNVNIALEQKAKELENKTEELERMNKYMVGREIRMAELKEKIKELEDTSNAK